MRLFTRIAKAGKGYNPNRDKDGQFASGDRGVDTAYAQEAQRFSENQRHRVEVATARDWAYQQARDPGYHESSFLSELPRVTSNQTARYAAVERWMEVRHPAPRLTQWDRTISNESNEYARSQYHGKVEAWQKKMRSLKSRVSDGVAKAGGYNPNRAAGGRFGSGAGGPTAGGKGKKPSQPEKPGSVADHMDLKKLGGAGHKLLDRMMEYMESDAGSDLESMHQPPRVKKLHKLTEKVAELSDKAVAGELKPGEATKLVTSLRESVKLFRQIKGGKR